MCQGLCNGGRGSGISGDVGYPAFVFGMVCLSFLNCILNPGEDYSLPLWGNKESEHPLSDAYCISLLMEQQTFFSPEAGKVQADALCGPCAVKGLSRRIGEGDDSRV